MTDTVNYKRTKLACYTAYFTMASVFALPPLLLVTFHNMYNISYTLLGTLILVNFCTQLTIDLIFTFFTKYFNVEKVLKVMPLITSLGLFTYALFPMFIPKYAYLGLIIGTILFSVSAGLSEVLLSPVISAIPSDNANNDMSMLHSLYAFGVITVVLISTFFLKLFGNENWMYLTMFWAVLPIFSAVLFMMSPIPQMKGGEETSKTVNSKNKTVGIMLCVMCIFLGSCAENVMSSWISSFMETALNIDKALGDILGMAMFAVLLGFTRMGYAKVGKNIFKMLLIGMVGSVFCYWTVAFSQNPFVNLFACVITGFFVAMLWPGTLIMMEENIPGAGVTAYALMAAGGDLGGSVAPQLMGIIVDKVTVSNFANELSIKTGFLPEQIGMKAGMLVNSLFPLLGVAVLLCAIRYFKKQKSEASKIQ